MKNQPAVLKTVVRAIASPAGRIARVAIGTSLVGTGLARGRKGWGLTMAGLLPLAMGGLDLCLLAPLLGLPFDGPRVRAALDAEPATPPVVAAGRRN